MVELHGICASRQQRSRKVTRGRTRVRPALIIGIGPMHDDPLRRISSARLACHIPPRGAGDVAREVARNIVKEGHIVRARTRDAAACHGEDIGAVETLTVRLGLHVARVHVIGEGVVVTRPVDINIAEEWSAGALLDGADAGPQPAGVNSAICRAV